MAAVAVGCEEPPAATPTLEAVLDRVQPEVAAVLASDGSAYGVLPRASVLMRIRAPWPAPLVVQVDSADLTQVGWSDTSPAPDAGRFAFDVVDANTTPATLLLRVDLPASSRSVLSSRVAIATRSEGVLSGWLVVPLTEVRTRGGRAYALSTADLDDDLLSDVEEATAGTSPMNPDSDGDGVFDGAEVRYGISPTNPMQTVVTFYSRIGLESQRLNRCQPIELPCGPDVDRTDSDGDGIWNQFDFAPADSDRDDDGLRDDLERSWRFPADLSLDLDPGGCTAAIGNHYSLDDDFDTDNDDLSDGEEVLRWASHPARIDTDLDWSLDIEEVWAGSNPRDPGSQPPGIRIPVGTHPLNC